LRKLKESDWDGAIFAEAGLGRMGLIPDEALILDWMIPAPGQGTVGITCRKEDENTFRRLREINHRESELRALAERSFLRKVEGGCSAPVGAFAEIKNQKLYLKAGVFSLDGKKQVLLTGSAAIEEAQELGEELAFKALSQGAAEIMKSLKNDQ
jgi:hydroxymethylbilane synthase